MAGSLAIVACLSVFAAACATRNPVFLDSAFDRHAIDHIEVVTVDARASKDVGIDFTAVARGAETIVARNKKYGLYRSGPEGRLLPPVSRPRPSDSSVPAWLHDVCDGRGRWALVVVVEDVRVADAFPVFALGSVGVRAYLYDTRGGAVLWEDAEQENTPARGPVFAGVVHHLALAKAIESLLSTLPERKPPR